MDTFRFGRKLSLPSTIAIKHQVRMLMADDRAKKAEEEASQLACLFYIFRVLLPFNSTCGLHLSTIATN